MDRAHLATMKAFIKSEGLDMAPLMFMKPGPHDAARTKFAREQGIQ